MAAWRKGARLAYRQVEPRTMGDVVVRDLNNGRITTLTEANPQLKSLVLGDQKAIKWRSFDGKEIWGLLVTLSRPVILPSA